LLATWSVLVLLAARDEREQRDHHRDLAHAAEGSMPPPRSRTAPR
jgi:hypothetical protein